MQGIFGSVRRSLHDESVVGTVDKINSRIRKSRISSKPSPPRPSTPKDNVATIPWRKGELIGSGAFGRVYMGMNLDTGELLAVKEVLITASSASKDKAQAHVKELEEEVKLLKNLSHPNIVRYLGTVREEDTLNILLEFVPGGSISSLLGKFGSFPEAVISTYTKQLLQGLEYLHKNVIMHRDIKGANILVDNKGCIKVADFGASKQVVELATVSGAKSMKGTPYWMAPEVILQTGHSFSADIWSVGCTVIEMATGRPPWSQQYQEVAALFHIGTTKSHPPIPEHLSYEAKDFLLKCLQKEPNLRLTAFELLQHPFVTGEYAKSHHAFRTSVVVNSESPLPTSLENYQTTFRNGMTDVCSTVRPTRLSESRHIWETNASDGDMCQFDDRDYLPVDEVKTSCVLMPDDFIKSFNPMCEPSDDWGCKLVGPLEPEHREMNLEIDQPCYGISGCCREVSSGGNILLFPSGPSLSEDDEELTESKIRVFLDEKAGELKKLQTPLYEEYYHIMGATCSPKFVERNHDEIALNYVKLPPKSSSPSWGPIGTLSPTVVAVNTLSPGSSSRCVSNVGSSSDPTSQDILSSPLNDQKGVIGEAQQEPSSPSASLSERLRKWKEELDEELERTREMKRQAGVGRKSVSPKDRALIWQRERTRFGSPGK